MIYVQVYHYFSEKEKLEKLIKRFQWAAKMSKTNIATIRLDIDQYKGNPCVQTSIKLLFDPDRKDDVTTAKMLAIYINHCLKSREINADLHNQIFLG